MVVPNPYADAVAMPSKQSIDAAAAERKLSHSVSTSSSEGSTDSASQIQNYISTHYNVRARRRSRMACDDAFCIGNVGQPKLVQL